jgi:hypothetical protein
MLLEDFDLSGVGSILEKQIKLNYLDLSPQILSHYFNLMEYYGVIELGDNPFD